MAEPENYEEDLFADLYTEDDAPPKQESLPEVKAEAAASTELKAEVKEEPEEQNGEGDPQMYGGEQDMDDEIDFNLGGNSNNYEAPAQSHHHNQEAHGPGIKEDG